MRNQTKKQLKEFNNEIIETLNYYGATKVTDHKYTMDSEKIGKLHITLDEDTSPIYTIFARFDDSDKAMKYFNVSRNGKLNSHEYTPEPCLTFIDSLLDNYNQINGIDSHAQYEAEKAI